MLMSLIYSCLIKNNALLNLNFPMHIQAFGALYQKNFGKIGNKIKSSYKQPFSPVSMDRYV